MSVLIKGMKMPRACIECRFYEDEYCYARGAYGSEWGKSTGCPLVELPPHGRLIDESDIMKSAEELRKSPWYNDEPYHAMRKDGFEMAIYMAVKDAPTIIEAEEAEQ